MFIEKICVATDGSDLAVRAAQLAVLLARTGGGRIVAFSAALVRFPLPPDTATRTGLEPEVGRALASARAHADTVERIAHASGVACEVVTVLAPAPGPEIVRAALDRACDLIVMGAHGPGDANPRAAGSTVQYMLAHSPLPVLVYRDPREASPPEFHDTDAP